MTTFKSDKVFDWWIYQQKLSWTRIIENLRLFLIYVPLGYVEAIVHLVVAFFSIPIVFSRGLYYWIRSALTRELKYEDFALLDDAESKALAKQGLRNYNFSLDFLQKTSAFILGAILTLITVYMTNNFGKLK